jgi:threonine/homoserine/homoserine lactone efflux protein
VIASPVLAAYLAFAFAAGLLVITPGLDTALVLRTAASDGARKAMAVVMGVCTGVIVWGGAVAVGLSAIFEASHLAYTILRWAGAGYLCYLGAGMLLHPRQNFEADLVGPSVGARTTLATCYRRGLLTNLLNPKVGVFYATFLPQFVPVGVPIRWFMVSLSMIHAAEGVVWFGAILTLARPVLGWLRRPSAVRALDRVTGTVLVGFGAKLALDDR